MHSADDTTLREYLELADVPGKARVGHVRVQFMMIGGYAHAHTHPQRERQVHIIIYT